MQTQEIFLNNPNGDLIPISQGWCNGKWVTGHKYWAMRTVYVKPDTIKRQNVQLDLFNPPDRYSDKR